MQITEEAITAALEAWHRDWLEGPPEQDERSAMRAALEAASRASITQTQEK